MEQYPEIIAIHTEVVAHLVFVSFLEKYLFQQASVSLGHFLKDLPDFLAHLLGGDGANHV